MRYVLLVGSHGRVENGQNRLYRAGDLIECTPQEAANLGQRIAPYMEPQPASESKPLSKDAEVKRESKPKRKKAAKKAVKKAVKKAAKKAIKRPSGRKPTAKKAKKAKKPARRRRG